LRFLKEQFHATGREQRARLVSLVGQAGIGKSRLAWEFEKYIDGLADNFWWHRGRCLAYGDGVAYWALAEMVRMRAGILEEEAPDSGLLKLRASIEEHVADAEERTWLEPRLAHLLGLADRTAPDREDLFSAWRLFFERLADAQPVILVFEDLHWADTLSMDLVSLLMESLPSASLLLLCVYRPEREHKCWHLPTIAARKCPDCFTELRLRELTRIGNLAADCVSRAIARAVYAAETLGKYGTAAASKQAIEVVHQRMGSPAWREATRLRVGQAAAFPER
jgi:hypothetical protein